MQTSIGILLDFYAFQVLGACHICGKICRNSNQRLEFLRFLLYLGHRLNFSVILPPISS